MRVFVTGGSGMVGRNFRELATLRGWLVDAPSHAQLDLFDAAATRERLEGFRPDFVVHCAGVVGGIAANVRAPYDFCHGNLLLGANVVDASQRAGVSRLLNLGSSCMYPRSAPNPLREESILEAALEPTNEGYAIAKIATARLCDYASAQHGVSYKTLIPCNLYGRYDKFEGEGAHLIGAIISKLHRAIQQDLEHVEIWGDGTARREFMFAEDLAAFMCMALERFSELDAYTNVGFGQDHSVSDYYATAAAVLGFTGDFAYDTAKPAGMAQKLVDTRKQRQMGWGPATSLQDGIRKTYEYFSEGLPRD